MPRASEPWTAHTTGDDLPGRDLLNRVLLELRARQGVDATVDDGSMVFDTTTWRCGPPPSSGQRQRYPTRFVAYLRQRYPEMLGPDTLHMFAGSADWGITTDVRPATGAAIVAPYDAIPLADGSASSVLADPPYANHWADEWHAELPRPKTILREAARIVRPAGLIGVLHIIVVPAYREFDVERVALHPVLCGPNNAIRVFNVFRKRG